MNNKNILISLVVLVVIAGGLYLLMNNNSSAPVTTDTGTTPATTPTSTTPAPAPKTTTPTTATTPKVSNPVDHQVSITNFSFSPSNITIKKGDSVTWTNMDSASHTVTGSVALRFGSSTLTKGQNYSFTFNEVGTYSYHCNFHPSMTGTVTVIN